MTNTNKKTTKGVSAVLAALEDELAESEFLTQRLLAAKMVSILTQKEHYGSNRRLANLLGGGTQTAMERWFTNGATPSRENLLRLGSLLGMGEEVGSWVNQLKSGSRITTATWVESFDRLLHSEKATALRDNLRQRISEIHADEWVRLVPLILDQVSLDDSRLVLVNSVVMGNKSLAEQYKPRITDLLKVS